FSFAILNAISCPILIIDRDYSIVGANNSACLLFGCSPDNIIGHKCFEITHHLDRACWQEEGILCPTKAAFVSKERTTVIHKHSHLTKSVFEQIIATPLLDDQGNADFVIEEINDMTELVESKEVVGQLKEGVKVLHGLLSICSNCKKIRDRAGHWNKLEAYIANHSEANFSHGLCETCVETLYGEETWFKETIGKVYE
ncbi:MAG: PAS domain-containing protein, partial [Candidatus Electrothrix sp. AUS4]|nr:PAS domain-containing protein [Candidatus Electrothrix sp. AUS4]